MIKSIPLSLLSISTYLHKEYEVIIVDQRIKGWDKKLNLALEKNDVLCIGITSYTGKQIKYGLEIVKQIKFSDSNRLDWCAFYCLI